MRHSNLHRLSVTFTTVVLVIALAYTANAQIQGTTTAPAAQANTPAVQAASAQAPAAPAAPPQICGNTAFCYETNDFAATITSFRITTDAAKRQILDLSIRFQNKTNQQLVLGYVNASGNASDDRGNRLVPWGPNASRGLGLVYGATFDPKFAVRPTGFGDAQFEFYPQGYPQVVGFTYTLDLSIAEINTFEGNQHTLGEEFPLHFQGLQNGSASVSPGFSAGAAFAQGGMGNAMSNPCATAGSLSQGAGQAASTVGNAATAISSLGSIFHHNKTQNAGQAAANAVGCNPNATTGLPTPAMVTTNATGTLATTTSTVQQAVSKTVVQPASTNPLNPLASTPAQAVVNASQSSTVKTTTASAAQAQRAGVAQKTTTSAAVVPAKPASSAKPTPAKPAKPQTPKPANTTVNPN